MGYQADAAEDAALVVQLLGRVLVNMFCKPHVDVRFAPKATELPRRREVTPWASRNFAEHVSPALRRASVGIALGRRNHEAGAWKMHTDLADRGFAASDDDLMNARGDQFADDRIASGIIRSNADDLARLPPDGIFRVGGCFRD